MVHAFNLRLHFYAFVRLLSVREEKHLSDCGVETPASVHTGSYVDEHMAWRRLSGRVTGWGGFGVSI